MTGPRKVNGVPLRRVNQVYTITTSTKVSTAGVNVNGVTDKTFSDGKEKSQGRSFFEDGGNVKKEVSADRVKLQTDVDKKLIENIKSKKDAANINRKNELLSHSASKEVEKNQLYMVKRAKKIL